jgi:hypothetical protein
MLEDISTQDILAADAVDELVAAHGASGRLRVLYTLSRVRVGIAECTFVLYNVGCAGGVPG